MQEYRINDYVVIQITDEVEGVRQVNNVENVEEALLEERDFNVSEITFQINPEHTTFEEVQELIGDEDAEIVKHEF